MAQLNWTYYSLRGLPYSIDMYHGDESHRLIVFVNSEIVHIDLDKKTSSQYSFYIENQLLTLTINDKGESCEYVLTPQPIMPLEENIEKIFDEHFWIPIIILIIAVNLIFLFIR